MRIVDRNIHLSLCTLLLGGYLGSAALAQDVRSDTELQSEITSKALKKSKLENVHVSMHDGVATLTGTVGVYDLKEES